MAKYIFQTTATMKPHNNKKWWIDPDIIRDMTITADNLREALKQYQAQAEEKYYVTISDNAIRTKSPMFVDTRDGETKQIGYVITGKTDFDKGDYTGYSAQYIDLWVTVLTIIETDFE